MSREPGLLPLAVQRGWFTWQDRIDFLVENGMTTRLEFLWETFPGNPELDRWHAVYFVHSQ